MWFSVWCFVVTATSAGLRTPGGQAPYHPTAFSRSTNELRSQQPLSYDGHAARSNRLLATLKLPRIPAVFAYIRKFFGFARPFAVKGLIATVTASAAAQQPAQNRPARPLPDIFLATMTTGNGMPRIGSPLNITDRAGYDNQPAFSRDERAIFFTSVREDAQADIYRYDIGTKRITRVTRTAPESEYSATPIESGRAISVVRVERDSTQRLWRFPLNGGAPSVIVERVRPVGYHAWADDHTVALFVLGSPNALLLVDTHSGTADTIASGIGRSLSRIPGTRRISFVRVESPVSWIESLDPATRAIKRLVALPQGVEDYAWLPNGTLVCGQDSRLLWWSGKSGEDWREIADLTSANVKGITRLAVSPNGDRIALVAIGRAGP